MAKRGPKVRTKQPSTLAVETPKGLDADERAEFVRLVEALRARGMLERCDVRLIESAARTILVVRRAHKELGAGPYTLETPNGTQFPHPMLGVLRVQSMLLRGLLADLGLSPKTSKLGEKPGEKKADDPWEGLLNVAG